MGMDPCRATSYGARKVENRSVRTTVVKCGLAGRLKEPALRDAIHGLVRYTSEALHRAGLVLTYVVNKAIACDEPVPDITDQTYIDRAVQLGASARAREPTLQAAWDDVFSAYPEPVQPPGPVRSHVSLSRLSVKLLNLKCVVETRLGPLKATGYEACAHIACDQQPISHHSDSWPHMHL